MIQPGNALPAAAQRVSAALALAGVQASIVMTSTSARTAVEAAASLQIELGQIVKSLVFRIGDDDRALMVLAAGDRRVDERKISVLLGLSVGRADAEFVRRVTGFAIGGVSPIAHATSMAILADQSLARFDQVWAAAGTPHAVFAMEPRTLFRITNAVVADVVID